MSEATRPATADRPKITAQLEAMPDAGMVPVSFARQAVQEVREERLSAAAERVETIEMWVRIGTRHYSGESISEAARARLLEGNPHVR